MDKGKYFLPSCRIRVFWTQKFPVFLQLMRAKAAAFSFDSGRMINYTEVEAEQQLCLPRDLIINTEISTCESASALAVKSLVVFNWLAEQIHKCFFPDVKEPSSPATVFPLETWSMGHYINN